MIGGTHGTGDRNMEYIPINNILSNTWTVATATFPEDIQRCNAVTYGKDIYVINGRIEVLFNVDGDNVYIIDSTTDTITLSPDNLASRNGHGTAIIFDDTIYLFGSHHGTDRWQKYQLPPIQTADPTTSNPTTSEPTTAIPTTALPTTADPTADPSQDPTSDPTFDPTLDPTADPTIDPTSDPTADPTQDPTADPSVDPTADPTIDPTVDPTAYPTDDAVAAQYIRGPTKVPNWGNAESYCQSIGSHLASIHSAADQEAAKLACGVPGDHSCWLGLSDHVTNGVWVWTDGSITDYGFNNNDPTSPTKGIIPWDDHWGGQPDNHGGVQHCIYLMQEVQFDGRWADAPCGHNVFYPLCNQIATSDPTTATPTTASPTTADPTTSSPTTVNAGWVSPDSPLLPIASRAYAAGLYQDVIFLLSHEGPSNGGKAQIEYNITSDSFTMSYANPYSVLGSYSQFWVQVGHKIYTEWASSGTSYINEFDLSTKTWTPQIATMPINTHFFGCIAGNKDYLYIIGGEQPAGSLQIFSFADDSWTLGPNLNHNKRSTSCAYVEATNKLYALPPGIESISTININSNAWQIANDPSNLAVGRYWANAAVHGQYIYMVGGHTTVIASDQVLIIDSVTDAITLSSDTLVFGVSRASPIVANNVLYVFGGYDLSYAHIQQWQYKNLLSQYLPKIND